MSLHPSPKSGYSTSFSLRRKMQLVALKEEEAKDD